MGSQDCHRGLSGEFDGRAVALAILVRQEHIMDEQLEDGIVGLPQGEEINREGMQWFVVHCLTGQEMRSKRYIDAQKITEELSDSVGTVSYTHLTLPTKA